MANMLKDSFYIRGHKIANRICVPPMVMFRYTDDSGMVTERNVAHYRAMAKGGAGLIIQEATCITREGRLSPDQLGIWSDEQIPGLKRIADAVHAEGGKIVVQIHHAGINGISKAPMSASEYTLSDSEGTRTARAMTEAEIQQTTQDFIDAARRAWQAGYDGIELHGCHGYLFSQFFNNRVNRRTDKYADAMEFVAPVFAGMRAATSEDFILGIRLGAFEPDLAAGIANAQAVEKAGADFIDASYGFGGELDPECPADWPYVDIVYAAGEVKKHVNIPVFAVNSINTPEQAQDILARTGVDMVDIGRSMLVDPEWANKALGGKQPGKCLHCKKCKFAYSFETDVCAGRTLMERQSRG